MNLTKLEKSVIIILVVGGILAAGIFLFIMPAYEQIGKETRNRDNLIQQRTDLYAKLERELTIDEDIAVSKKEAKEYELNFYPDLTTYEAVELTLAHLKDSGLKTLSIQVSPTSARGVNLAYFRAGEVVYDMKSYSRVARGEDPNALEENQFIDGGKKYEVVVSSIDSAQILDENGDEVPRSRYTEKMKDEYKKGICRYAVTNEMGEMIGSTSASFEVTGSYEDYLKFIDYIYDLDRATYIDYVVIPITGTVTEETQGGSFDDEGNFISELLLDDKTVILEEHPETLISAGFTIYYFNVEPMEALDSITEAGETIVLNQ